MNAIHLGPVTLYPYGLCLAAGAAACLLWMLRSEKKGALPDGTVSRFAVWAIPLAVLCGRLGHFLVCMNWYLAKGPAAVFDFTAGGYLLYGAMAGTALAAWITAKRSKCPAGTVLDAAAAPAGLLIFAARMAEPLVGLGYGHNIEEWFDPWLKKAFVSWEDPSPLYRFPFGLQDYYEDWNFGIFFPEALAALIILILLLRRETKRPGTKTLLFLVLYAGSQAVLESMRYDAVLRWGFVKVNQFMTLPVFLLAVTVALRRIPREARTRGDYLLGCGSVLLGCGIIMAMEFALEQKISFLTWMRMDLCYLVMILAAAGMIVCAARIIRKSDSFGGSI